MRFFREADLSENESLCRGACQVNYTSHIERLPNSSDLLSHAKGKGHVEAFAPLRVVHQSHLVHAHGCKFSRIRGAVPEILEWMGLLAVALAAAETA